MSKQYWCYILANSDEKYKNYTYCGFTVDPQHRLRQHNGEIKGGAKATHNKGTWHFIFLITGFKTMNNALSCEWRLKHPDGKRVKNKKYNGIPGRILSINDVLKLEKWTEKCDINNCDCEYTIYAKDTIMDKIIFDTDVLNIDNAPINVKKEKIVKKQIEKIIE